MMEFISLIKRLFPLANPDDAESTLIAIESNFKGRSSYLDLECCNTSPIVLLTQGDIVTDLPFRYLDDNGNMRKITTRGFLLSLSCDVDNKPKVLFAAMIPIKDYVLNGFEESNIVHNKYTNLFYIPSSVAGINDHVVDLSLVMSASPKLINQLLEQQQLTKLSSLNQVGYYLMLAKLAQCFLRPEDEETEGNREKN